jgi:hypothetical protein
LRGASFLWDGEPMLVLPQEIEAIWNNATRKYYESKSYLFTHYGDIFKVNVLDLSPKSSMFVEVKCDYCGRFFKKRYYVYTQELKGILKNNSCNECKFTKTKESNLLVYGIDAVFKLPNVYEERIKKKKLNIEDVKKEFIENNCILLSEAINSSKDRVAFLCKKHPEEVQFVRYNNFQQKQGGCKLCGKEKIIQSLIVPYEEVEKEVENCGYILVTTKDEYRGAKQKLEIRCTKHLEEIQKINYHTMKSGRECCKYCYRESREGENSPNWTGKSPLRKYLREHSIVDWKKESMKDCNYKCVISGGRFDEIHHLINVDTMIQETLDFLGLQYRNSVSFYTNKELEKIISKFLELHDKHPLGVCLTKEIHKLFHKRYGYTNNSPEQFEEFKLDYLSGKYEVSVAV